MSQRGRIFLCRSGIIALGSSVGLWWRSAFVVSAAFVLMLMAFLSPDAAAQLSSRAKPARATRPNWAPENVADIFFDDAFETLSGKRPRHLMPDQSQDSGVESTAKVDASQPATEMGWSRLVEAATLEAEVKRQIQTLQQSVKSPNRFAGGGFRDASRQFGYLATLFRVIADFDADVRWKQSAAAASHRCGELAKQSERGSPESFTAAKSLRGDLSDLLNGQSIDADGRQLPEWSQSASRRGWMRWIESAAMRIKSNAASTNSLKQTQSRLIADAQMLRMIADVLVQDGMEDGDDEDYRMLCKQLSTAAENLHRSVENSNFEDAAEATGKLNQSCANCHELYKG